MDTEFVPLTEYGRRDVKGFETKGVCDSPYPYGRIGADQSAM